MEMKFVIIEAGALRNIGAIRDYCLIGKEVAEGEIVLVDTDPERLSVMADVAGKMPEVLRRGAGFAL